VVGLVIVSHSAGLAAGVVELARQMGGEDVAIEPAGGMTDPPGAIGTDVELVRSAIERAAGPDGVVVLMDLGSAVMSAEMAGELFAAERPEVTVVLCEGPLVEGAVAAAARARAGASLDEVADEARGALAMKAVQLGVEEGPATDGGAPRAAAVAPGAHRTRLHVGIPLGLHARPAARVVQIAASFDARVTVADETTGRGPADAGSLTALLTLGAAQGHDLVVTADGPDAEAALAALGRLAKEGFGDEVPGAPAGGGPAAGGPVPVPVPVDRPTAAAEAPAAGARLDGVPASPGIAIGPARHPTADAATAVAVAAETGPVGDAAGERARLQAAIAEARDDIDAARTDVAERAGAAEAAIFDAHLLLLGDAALVEPAHRAIEAGEGAAVGWGSAVEATADAYRRLDDPYLRERAADVEDVGARVLRHLTGAPPPALAVERGILVVPALTPGEAAALDPAVVEGVAVAHGGATSHAAILTQALGIPSVVGLGDAVLAVAEGTPLVLDGEAGTVEVDLPPAELTARRTALSAAEARRQDALRRAGDPARTRDGRVLEVGANVGTAAEVAGAVALGADGVGLLRTEFLFLDRDEAPGEDEQRAAYEEVAAALDGRSLIIRTLDAGADKPLRYLRQPPEDNPFLGVRGIRLGLARPDVLESQLRAILGLAGRYPVRIMLPMVATLAEYRAARATLERLRAELAAPPVQLGIMVEVPAVAVAAGRFAREVDFFSIGTNDLGQYTMAAERGNDEVAELLRDPAPAVLRLVSAVTAGAREHGRWVGVCGQLAGDPAAAVLLAGLGVDELSMAAPRIPAVKDALRGVSLAEARRAAEEAMDADDAPSARASGARLVAWPRDDG
jgi:phosphoenolpyruvate-protein phosphotransferase/dihydroxyacetone kinase phosphotransfer subunit